MPQTYLVFDFGANEDAAQQARHRIDGWKQSFRLGNKVQFKIERQDSELPERPEPSGKGTKKEKEPESNGRVRLLVRLDFSNHEKHLFQQWLQRIPAEEPFKSAKPEAVHHGDPDFDKTSDLFDNLN
ncbi:MAG TPA: hypothetical protein VGT03_01805 [Candidatus Acidoferrales bacterium]|nr:hypothetical protein [Candidatus Acidoferrales bacterium]